MTQRTTPPFRADHVGSLLRPAELAEARAKAKRGELSAEQLRAVQDKHIREAVAKQESVGIQAVTDGEFRRDWWHIDFIHGFDGVELAAGDAYGDAKFKNTEEQPPFMTVKGKIRRSKPSMLEHFKFLKSVAKRTPKFTMPSPAMLHARGDRASLKKTWPTARRSPTCTRQAAATCRSTTRPSPCGATRRSRSSSGSSATTRRRTRRCTPTR